MKNALTKFAFIKSLLESDNDFIGVFAFFVLQTLDKPTNIQEIKKELLHRFTLDVPTDLIITLVKRLRKNGFVKYEEIADSICLTGDGVNQNRIVDSEINRAEREMNSLLEGIKKYAKETQNKDLTAQQIEKTLNDILKHNADVVCMAMTRQDLPRSPVANIESANIIIDFVSYAEKSDSTNFERLKSLIFGCLITTITWANDIASIKRNFESLNIYLDANIVFSLMELDEDRLNIAAQELFEIMKKFGLEASIFSITKDQIVSVLRGYINEFDHYPANIKIDSIYSVMKQKGYSKQDILLKIAHIEEELNKLGIRVDHDIEFETLEVLPQEHALLEEIKPNKSDFSYNHDIKIVKAIRKLRGGDNNPIIEKQKAILLSADKKLFNYDVRQYGHKETGNIPEVFLKDYFVTLLWLKKPDLSSNLPLHNVIAGYSTNLIISKDFWDIFLKELGKAQAKGEIDDNDIHILISDNEIQNMLLEIQNTKESFGGKFPKLLDQKIKNFKKERAELAEELGKSKDQEEIIKRTLLQTTRKLETMEGRLSQAVENAVKQQEIERIEKLAMKAELHCKKQIRKRVNTTIIIGIVILVISAIFLPIKYSIKEHLWVITILLFLISFFGLLVSMIKRRRFIFLNYFIQKEQDMINKCVINEKNKYL